MREVVSSPGAPAAIGPYSAGVRAGNLLFLSGSIPLDPATGQVVPGDVTAQATRVMENIKALLSAAGVPPASPPRRRSRGPAPDRPRARGAAGSSAARSLR